MTIEHPTLEELVELAQRDDPSRVRESGTLAHVRGCDVCEELFVPLRLLAVGARAERRRRRRWTLGLAATAASALILLLVLVVFPGLGGLSSRGMTASGPDSAGSEPVPGVSELAPGASPADPASLADPGPVPGRLVDIRISLLGGMPVSDRTYLFDLRRGWEALGDADYDAASETFEKILRERPSDMEAAGMLGVATYLAGDDSERTEALLERGGEQRQGLRQRLAIWYLGNLHLRRGDTEAAIAALQRLQPPGDLSDHFSRRADALLERIEALRAGEPPR